MTLKAFPCYEVIIEGANGDKSDIKLPFTTEINITRQIQNGPPEANLTLYNLNMNTRENLYFDRYNFAGYRSIEIYLGYGGQMSLCFKGNVMECYSVRSGVNFETHVNAWDGGMYYTSGWNSRSYDNKDPQSQIIALQDEVAKSKVTVGKISDKVNVEANEILRPQAYFGKTLDNIQNIVGEQFDVFVENEQLYVMKNDEAREGNVTVINAETGLIETPRKMEYTLELTMMLEPRLQIGQLAKLESITAPRFNGTYKIIGVDHSATISENESNQNTTKVTLLYSAGGFSNF